MRALVIGAVLALWATAASAADKPIYAPPAAWVKPALAVKPGAPDSAAVRLLSRDSQTRYTADGQEAFIETVRQVQSPLGLAALGNLSVSWRPESDVVTIHKVHLIRGGQVIDLLGQGQTFTILRRERDLELAMLDGRLTATLQPEGLQVGDIIDFAMTLKRSDPILKDITGDIQAAATTGVPLDHLRVRALWPSTMPVRWRQADGAITPKLTSANGETELLAEADNLQPLKRTRGAPDRYLQTGFVEIARLKSWGELSTMMTPLYAKASMLKADSPLKQEAARIKASSRDPKVQAGAALRLVQDKVRYLFLGMNNGGYVPADADTTWTRLFGDCKAKTALLLALLNELGIQAEPAFVSTSGGDGLDERLPLVELFDHVLVRATIGGKVYWLDGTRSGDRGLDRIRTPAFYWALPVRAQGAVLEKLVQEPLDQPIAETIVRIDASKGLDALASVHAEQVLRGDASKLYKTLLDNQTAANRDTLLRNIWKSQYEWADLKTVGIAYDEETAEVRLTADGAATIQWRPVPATPSRQYLVRGSNVGWRLDIDRTGDPNPDAPYKVGPPVFTRATETVVLPYGGQGFTVVGEKVDKTLAGFALSRKAAIEKGVFTMEITRRTVAPEISIAEAKAAVAELRSLSEGLVGVRSPYGYRSTEQDVAQLKATTPATAAELVTRAGRMMGSDRKAAFADLDEAIRLDPKMASAWGARGYGKVLAGDYTSATADIDKALELDPRQVRAITARGLMEFQTQNYDKAIQTLTDAIEIDSAETVPFQTRARAYAAQKNYERAIRDASEVVRRDPTNFAVRNLVAEMHIANKAPEKALPEFDKLIELQPGDPLTAGRRMAVLELVGKTAEAQAVANGFSTTAQKAQLYGAAGGLLIAHDPQRSRAYVEQALKLDGKSVAALATLVALDRNAKDDEAEARDLGRLIEVRPQDASLWSSRAFVLGRLRRTDAALRDADEATKRAPDIPSYLNARCFLKATLNVQLASALEDCEAALKAEPGRPETLDSRALVKLRLGRYAEAIADYDAALKTRPSQADSLWGRGIAKLRQDAKADGEADLAAARKISPLVEKTYAGYGLTP